MQITPLPQAAPGSYTRFVPSSTSLPAELLDASFHWPGGRGVEAINLRIERGETVTLLGPNGAGKSTVLKLLSGEISPEAGSVRIFGASHSADIRRRIGLVLQEPSTDDLMSLDETLQLHGRLFGLRGRELRRRCGELLGSLGLEDRAGDRCETLSGGLRRRLDLARALLHEPEILLLDEPTLALDPESSAAIWDTLGQRAQEGVAIVVCSNDTTEAEAHSDRVIVIDQGRIAAEGSPAQLTANLRSDALELEWPDPARAELDEIEGWDDVGQLLHAPPILHLTVDSAADFVPRLFQRHGERIRGIRIHESSLRDAWFQIVGHPLNGGDV